MPMSENKQTKTKQRGKRQDRKGFLREGFSSYTSVKLGVGEKE